MRISVVTNVAAPYRDDLFCELQRTVDAQIYFLATDEPGRRWGKRTLPFRYRKVPALVIRGNPRPRYIPLPLWVKRRGWILVAGYGLPALMTAALRPKSTLIWSEATAVTDARIAGSRARLRKWLVARSWACVAVGESSRAYLESLGARRVLLLPNSTDASTVFSSVASELGNGDLVIAHVGDWSLRKGADQTTEIFELLRKEMPASQAVRLIVAGNILDASLPTGAEHLGYLPYDDVWPALRARGVQFLVLMSRSEHWGQVITEAMAAGVLPVVSPNVGSHPDLVLPICADLVAGDPASAASVIARMHGDPHTYATTVAAAQEMIQARTSAWAVRVFLAGFDSSRGGVPDSST